MLVRLNQRGGGDHIALVYGEIFSEKEQAELREKFFKSGRGREELRKILDGAVPKW